MQIDWLTVSAQIVNFLILVWLLKRLLYQPVINAMARREEQIAARLEEAEHREGEADARSREYARKSEALEQAWEKELEEARKAAAQERRRLLDAARAEVDAQRAKWREDLQREQGDFRRAMKRQLAESVVEIARRALSSLADAALERQIVAAFLRQLRSLPQEARAPFARQALRLSSSFDLDDEARGRVREALDATADIEYVRTPELVCGIAVSGAGHKLEWNVSDYLGDLEQRVDELLAAAPATPEVRT
jgi:F-type H+-transporting ATPase subunit b